MQHHPSWTLTRDDWGAPIMESPRFLSPLEEYTPDTFKPDPYVPSDNIQRSSQSPRFGNPRDISVLFDGNSDESKDYVVGIIIGAIIIFLVALLWFSVIVGLRIAGKERVGFLAGSFERPVPKNSQSTAKANDNIEVIEGDDGDLKLQNEEEKQSPHDSPGVDTGMAIRNESAVATRDENKFNMRVQIVRGMFVLNGILVIVAGGVFYGKGVASFNASLTDFRKGLGLVQDIAQLAINLSREVQTESSELESDVETLDRSLQCDAIDLSFVREKFDNFNDVWDNVRGSVSDNLGGFEDDLNELINITENVDDGLDKADIFFYIMIVTSVVLIAIIVALLIAVALAVKGINNCVTKLVRRVFVLPIFIFILVLSWIFSTLFLVIATAGSDFCIDPDGIVLAFLEQNKSSFDSLIFGFVIYYVSGCTTVPPGEEILGDVANEIRTVIALAHDVLETVKKIPIGDLQGFCGTSAASAMISGADTLHDASHSLFAATFGVRDILSCSSFNPVYSTFVHDALCIEGVNGLTYMFGSSMAMAICCMMMLTFRAALYPVKEPK